MASAPVGSNLADRFVAAAHDSAEHEAVVVAGPDPVRLTYAQLLDRVERAAGALRARGVREDDRVAVLLDNGNEHLEVLLASFLLRAVPVNLSHRDTPDGVRAVLDACDARVVVHEPDLEMRGTTSLARGEPYERALASATPPEVEGRSGDDRYVLYTGGTTGAPKGVCWRHDDLFHGALAALGHRAVRCLPASPFAHGTGQWMALSTLLHGGTVVCRRDRGFDPEPVLDALAAEAVSYLVVVGDAFARPIADVLDACRGRWSLANLTTILSGGAALSPSVKTAVLDLLPTVLVVDGFGASETGGHGRTVSVPGSVVDGSPRFSMDDDTAILGTGDDGVGWLARRGHIALGYDGDDDASARMFPVIDGVRWALSGDRAKREPDGTITVLGRGRATINTGGHKVQAEEVERALRSHPAVLDAVVVGVPDERFGERVTAVVSARHDARPTLESIVTHCRLRIAGYKVPRHVVLVDEVRRSAAGKADYTWAKAVATG